MASRRRLGQRNWRFSDAGNRFDGRQRQSRQPGVKPISPALKRNVIYCSRCGSRVVSNGDSCPFCGRSLKPFFARLWFWILVVLAALLGVFWLVNVNLPEETSAPTSPANPARPQVVGGNTDASLRDLSLGTIIDNSGLRLRVTQVETGPQTSSGAQVYLVQVEFDNRHDTAVTLYSTQWMLEASDGRRLDTFVGSAADGSALTSSFEATLLPAGSKTTGTLCFAISAPLSVSTPEEGAGEPSSTVPLPASVLYQPSALAYSEELLVSWLVF